MPERAPECSDDCRALRLLEERVGRVQAAQQSMEETLQDVRVNVEPMRDIVANYKEWKQTVSDFIVRQDQHAIDLAANLAKQEKEDEKRRQEVTDRRARNQKILGAVGVVAFAISGFLGVKAWYMGWALVDLAKRAPEIQRLTDDWIRWYATPPVSPPVSAPTPKVQHKSFWQDPHASVKSKQQAPPQDAGMPQTYAPQ